MRLVNSYDVAAALDHAKIADGPGGAAEMVFGQHHVRMNMYIGRARAGAYEIVSTLGAIDPNERVHRQPAGARV
jgi:branched-chain amino acid transport system substrate-binding protein